VVRALALVAEGRYSIEEIDAMTGPPIGRPKSATFRTLDLAGIDILAHVVRNLAERLDDPAARATFVLPPFVEAMLARGWTGEKAGQGFYKRDQGRRRRVADSGHRSGIARVPPSGPSETPGAGRRGSGASTPASASESCSRHRPGSASSCAQRWRRRSTTPRR
jgi:3-hydroxyacyl-CoA dehydrogenase